MMDRKKNVKVVKSYTREKRSIPQTVNEISKFNEIYGFNRIIIDDAGLGAGVYDMLKDKFGMRKILAMNNARKSLEDEGRSGAVLKEDMYSNALSLMEQNKIEIIAHQSLEKSLKCMTFEYTENKKLLIHGKYSHLAEAFVRACWCVKAKSLNLFIA